MVGGRDAAILVVCPVVERHVTSNTTLQHPLPLTHSGAGFPATQPYASAKNMYVCACFDIDINARVHCNEHGNAGGRSEHATALGHVAARVRAQRAAKLQQDVEHMRAAAADMLGRPPAGGQGDRGGLPVGYPRVEGLASVITRLGQREQSLAFHVR